MVSNKVEYIVLRMSIVLVSKVVEMVLEMRFVDPASEVFVVTGFDFVVAVEIIEVDSSVGVDVVAIEEIFSEILFVVLDFNVAFLVVEETMSVSTVEVSINGSSVFRISNVVVSND